MNINKATKPIHIRCPYCKRDLQYNGASIKSQKEGLIKRIDSLSNKLKTERDPVQRRKLIGQMKDTEFRLKLLSEDMHMLSQLAEIETLKIFKRNCKQYLGDELYMKLLEEADKQYLEENTFNYYDLAIQHYTNFEGV